MKKLKFFQIAAAATALMAGVGAASSASAEGTITGNVALASDYVFRGISQTQGGPAVQGGFDYANGIFYAGTWASNVSSSTIATGGMELDLYAGIAPTVGPVALNFGVIGYFYPGSDDDAADPDFFEGKAQASYSPIEPLTLTGSLYYSPEFSYETGESLYWEIAGVFAATESLSFKAAYGDQDTDDYDGSYSNWLLGASYAYSGFTFGLTYTDTEDAEPAPGGNGYALEATDADEAFTFSISRAL